MSEDLCNLTYKQLLSSTTLMYKRKRKEKSKVASNNLYCNAFQGTSPLLPAFYCESAWYKLKM